MNPDNRPVSECESLMSELVEAYETLMADDDDDFAARFQVGHSNKVALACELYSLEELQMDRFHDVYALCMEFHKDEEDDEEDGDINEFQCDGGGDVGTANAVAVTSILPIHAHPEDSVSDLKRQLESEYGLEWGLLTTPSSGASSSANDNDNDNDNERRKDRDGLATGWELIVVRTSNITNNVTAAAAAAAANNSKENKSKGNVEGNSETDDEKNNDNINVVVTNEVLSYHLFLDDYQIRHSETIYAVIRKQDM